MRKRIGIACLFLGAICLISAVGLILYNRLEDMSAKNSAHALLEDVKETIKEETVKQPLPSDTKMETVEASGNECIGVISIPALKLELPILTDWSYSKLKKAPCHYYGSCYEKDFVIAAHNYKSHFGRLSELQGGDLVVFTDVFGETHCYEVVLLETLPKNATKEMITSGFDLSLYTCTLGGGSRVTVRCNKRL